MAVRIWLIATILVALVAFANPRLATAQGLTPDASADESEEPANEESSAAAPDDEGPAGEEQESAAASDATDSEKSHEPAQLEMTVDGEADDAADDNTRDEDTADRDTKRADDAASDRATTKDKDEIADEEQPALSPFRKPTIQEQEAAVPKRPLVSGPSAKAQAKRLQTHREETPPGTLRDPNAATSASNRGKPLITEAFAKTKTAGDEASLAEIIALCQSGLEAGLQKDNAAYARRLMAWSHNRRGEIRADAGSGEKAREDFETAVTLDPKHWRAVHNRGVSFAAAGNLDAAIADFDRTLQMNPKFANGYFNRGELRYDRREFAPAITDYTEAIRLNPKDAGAYNSRGHAYYRLNQFRSALADYTSAIRFDPANAAAYTNRGDAQADLGSYAEAVKDYQMAVKINPRLGRAYQSAAWLMATCPDETYRDESRAVETAEKAIELDGDDSPLYLETLAAAQANAGQFEEAAQTQQKAVKLVGDSDRGRAKRRLALYQKGVAFRDSIRSGATATAPKSPQRGPQR